MAKVNGKSSKLNAEKITVICRMLTTKSNTEKTFNILLICWWLINKTILQIKVENANKTSAAMPKNKPTATMLSIDELGNASLVIAKATSKITVPWNRALAIAITISKIEAKRELSWTFSALLKLK